MNIFHFQLQNAEPNAYNMVGNIAFLLSCCVYTATLSPLSESNFELKIFYFVSNLVVPVIHFVHIEEFLKHQPIQSQSCVCVKNTKKIIASKIGEAFKKSV